MVIPNYSGLTGERRDGTLVPYIVLGAALCPPSLETIQRNLTAAFGRITGRKPLNLYAAFLSIIAAHRELRVRRRHVQAYSTSGWKWLISMRDVFEQADARSRVCNVTR